MTEPEAARPTLDAVRRLVQLAALREARGDHATAGAAAEGALALLERLKPALAEPAGLRLRIEALGRLGNFHRHFARYAEAEPLLKAALELALTGLGEAATETAAARNNLGVLYKYTGQFDQAEALYYAALASLPAGPTHPLAAVLHHNLGGLEHARGRFAEGEPLARRAWEINRERLGEAHPTTLADAAAYAGLLDGLERFTESEPIYRRVIAEFEQLFGPGHYEVAVNVHNLAGVRFALGDGVEAEALFRRALTLKEDLLGADHPDTALTANNLGVVLEAQGRPAEARACFQRALDTFQRRLGPQHPRTAMARDNLAALGRPPAAAR